MPTEQEALKEALELFRNSVVEALADMQVQIAALELAVQKGAPKGPHLDGFKKNVEPRREEFLARYSDRLSHI